MKNIDTMTAEYGDIIKFAESNGYRRSAAAIEREQDEGVPSGSMD